MKDEKFQNLRFPVHKVDAETAEELFQHLPGLKRYFDKISLERKNIVKIIRYIVFMYDEGSDLVEEYPDDLQLRKDMAALSAKWVKKKDEWPKELQNIMEFKDENANQWILDYMKVQKNNIFREWMFCEQELDHNYALRSQMLSADSPENISKRSQILNQCDELVKKIKTYKTQFYEGNSDLQSATENNAIPISPENVFKVLDIPKEVYEYTQVYDVETD